MVSICWYRVVNSFLVLRTGRGQQKILEAVGIPSFRPILLVSRFFFSRRIQKSRNDADPSGLEVAGKS